MSRCFRIGIRLSIVSLLFPFTVNALSATTAKTIKGSEPKFTAVSGENRLGFTVNGKFYSESSTDTAATGKIESATPKSFNASLTFNDFAVKTLAAGDFTVANDYDDSDGDGAHLTTPFTVGSTTYKWSDNSGAPITGTNLAKMIGCGSGYSMPLKLEIKLDNVQVHSQYGDPRDSTLTALTKTYQISTESGICFAMPNQMIVNPNFTWRGWDGSLWAWNSGSSNASAAGKNGGGYSNDFDPTWGFKASASPYKFPTTGFSGAQFDLIMTGSQSDWTYSVQATPSGSVTVSNMSGSEGRVKLVSKPSGSVKITATLNSDSSISHDYIFNPTNIWAEPKLGNTDWTTSYTKCGGINNVLTRAELTNSPQNTALMGWTFEWNNYTRAIGGGVSNEWGYLSGSSYPGTAWASVYWTKDVYAIGSLQFLVNIGNGSVTYPQSSDGYYVACRG